MKTVAKLKMRRMWYEDIPGVLEIERVSFPHPWERQDFEDALLGKPQGRVLQVMAREDDTIVAYAIWERKTLDDPFRLLSLAVHPDHRLQGLGRSMVKRAGRRGYPMVADVIETNLGAQLFLQQLGWKCTEIVAQPYDESDRDALRFEAQYDCET